MKGKDCVSIAADRRFGVQAQTISTNFQKIFEMGPRLYIGFAGLATDVQTVYVLMHKYTHDTNLWHIHIFGCVIKY